MRRYKPHIVLVVAGLLAPGLQATRPDTPPPGTEPSRSAEIRQEDAPVKADPPGKAVPPSVAGQDVVGEKLPLDALRWLEPETAPADASPAPRATLVRWWTDGCPYCVASLPAVETLHQEFGAQGLACKAVYHPKPPREVADQAILKTARDLGFTGPVAVDPEWAFLRKHYLDKGRRHATSVAFLLDRDGTIRFVHGGPIIGTSEAYDSPEIASEYQKLREAIAVLLAE